VAYAGAVGASRGGRWRKSAEDAVGVDEEEKKNNGNITIIYNNGRGREKEGLRKKNKIAIPTRETTDTAVRRTVCPGG